MTRLTHNDSLRRCWALVLLVAAGLSATVFGATYMSNMAGAEWRVNSSAFECRLTYRIEQYGEASFSRRAGEKQRFYLHQRNRHLRAGEAELVAFSPRWRHEPGYRSLGRVTVRENPYPVVLDWRESMQLVSELQEGMRIMFVSATWHQGEQEVRLVLEPISFRPAYDQYQACLVGLLPVNFDQISRTAIYFAVAADELPDDELRKLETLVSYLLADTSVTGIFVDGHTDGTGLRAANLELSRRRAQMVTQYLVDRGVPASKITTRWHGERYPVASNQDPAGRAQNRRVSIRIDRPEDNFPPLAGTDQSLFPAWN